MPDNDFSRLKAALIAEFPAVTPVTVNEALIDAAQAASYFAIGVDALRLVGMTARANLAAHIISQAQSTSAGVSGRSVSSER